MWGFITMVNRDIELFMEGLDERPFFKKFSAEAIAQIKNMSIIRQYDKGQMLFYEQDPKNYYYFVLNGLIKLESRSYNGESIYADFITTNDFFPYGEVFGDDVYAASAEAETTAMMLMLPVDEFEAIVRSSPDVLLEMYKELSQVLLYHEKRVQAVTISSATERVEQMLALWTLDMGHMKDQHVIIPYPLTIIQLAEVAGTTRETAGKVIKRLTEEERINYGRKQIEILDADYFFKLIE